MTALHDALRAGLAPAAPRREAGAAAAAGPGRLLLVGAGGALGAAVLERLLGSRRWPQVATLVTQPVGVALRGFAAWPHGGWDARSPLPWTPDVAVLVFDPPRAGSRSARATREAALLQPQLADLPAIGRWLLAAGVRRLVVVLPHAPALLPPALRAGLASLDEQSLAALGFDHLVLVRPARHGPADGGGGPWLQRLAGALLAQLRWMVPEREQPLRPAVVAGFVAALLDALPGAPPGTRAAPPELLWDWSRPDGGDAVLQAWLRGRPLPATRGTARRW